MRYFSIEKTSFLVFVLKLWILTCVISTFVYLILNQYSIGNIVSFKETIFDGVFWESYFFILSISLIFSIPTILVLGIIIKLLTGNKLVLIPISVFLVFISFYLTGFMNSSHLEISNYIPPIIYSAIISILIWIMPLKKKYK
ncbi:MAG: hypothetical protein CSA38_02510 [Flavobacteriales bacterium]|nr:MAG: hypothetical protein CSA38_02510 [Flavobacteriales bacterium]